MGALASLGALAGAGAVGFRREKELATDQQAVETLGGRQIVEADNAIPRLLRMPPLVECAQQALPEPGLAARLGQLGCLALDGGAKPPPVLIISPAREISLERISSVLLVKGHCGHRSFSYEGEQGRLVPAGNGLRRYVP